MPGIRGISPARPGSARILVFCAAVTGCVGGGEEVMPELVRGEPLTLVSDDALARAEVTPADDGVFRQGPSTLIVEVSPLGGQGSASLEAVVPFMPAHGHGTAEVVVVPLDGAYRVEELNLFMPGRWEVILHLVVGEAADEAGFVVDVQ